MTDYEIILHVRESTEVVRIPLPGVSASDAEADRQALIYEIDEARLAEVPSLSIRTRSGFPEQDLALDPHSVTEVDLGDSSA